MAQCVKRAVAGALMHVAVQEPPRSRQTFNRRSAILSASRLVAVKHHCLMQGGVAQQMIEQAVLVRLVIDEVHLLLDVLVLRLRRGDADDLAVRVMRSAMRPTSPSSVAENSMVWREAGVAAMMSRCRR